jgi:hypothetical protein
VTREWITEGLRHAQERAAQQKLASERRLHHMSVVKAKGPDLMRELVAEVRSVIDEYRRNAQVAPQEIEFEELPQEGFRVAAGTHPRMGLQCRPGYETQILYCNLMRSDDERSHVTENDFNLDFTVDESDRVRLHHGNQVFHTGADAVEFLLKPVLFPPMNDDHP